MSIFLGSMGFRVEAPEFRVQVLCRVQLTPCPVAKRERVYMSVFRIYVLVGSCTRSSVWFLVGNGGMDYGDYNWGFSSDHHSLLTY